MRSSIRIKKNDLRANVLGANVPGRSGRLITFVLISEIDNHVNDSTRYEIEQ